MGGLTQVTTISLSYLLLGGFVTAFSLISLLIKERLFIGEVILGTSFGVVMGPYGINAFDPRSWGGLGDFVANSTSQAMPISYPNPVTNKITLEVTRVVLAVGLFVIGVELPEAYLWEHVKSLLVMVVPTMALGWVVSAGLLVALFPNLTFITALVISACLTPTDPILAATIIGGKFAVKNVPKHVRHLLSAESAANDGLAYPFLTVSLAYTLRGVDESSGEVFGRWFLVGCMYQVVLGTIIGSILGYICSILMKASYKNGLVDRESIVAQFLALAILTIGLVNTIGSDDLLAAFAAGTAVSWNGHFKSQTEGEVFAAVIDLVLNCACFIYIGAWLPFVQFNIPELDILPWKLVVLCIGILILRRIPCLLLIYKWVPDLKNWKEALFCGHFGPMGVGAIFISSFALSSLPQPVYPPVTQTDWLALTLQPIVAFIVLGSIIIHGLSIPVFWFGSQTTMALTRTLSRTFTGRSNNRPDWILATQNGDQLNQAEDGSIGETNRPVTVCPVRRAISIGQVSFAAPGPVIDVEQGRKRTLGGRACSLSLHSSRRSNGDDKSSEAVADMEEVVDDHRHSQDSATKAG